MENGQQRPHGATGSSCAEAERDLMQLDLWSALQPQYDTFEAAAGEHPRAFISKAQPARAPAQVPELKPKPLLIDPLGAPQAASAIDHGITPPVRDEFLASTPSATAAWFHPALIGGALVVAVGVGWSGGASPSFFFAPAAAPVQQADSALRARGPQGQRLRRRQNRPRAGAKRAHDCKGREPGGRRQSCARAGATRTTGQRSSQQRRNDDELHRSGIEPGTGEDPGRDLHRHRRPGRPRSRAGRSARSSVEPPCWRGLAVSGGRHREIPFPEFGRVEFGSALGQPLDRRDQQRPDLDPELIARGKTAPPDCAGRAPRSEPGTGNVVVPAQPGGHRPMATRKRELIEPHKGDKRYVRRDASGHFTDKQVDVGRSLAADRRSNSKTVAQPGQGDKGDRRPRAK